MSVHFWIEHVYKISSKYWNKINQRVLYYCARVRIQTDTLDVFSCLRFKCDDWTWWFISLISSVASFIIRNFRFDQNKPKVLSIYFLLAVGSSHVYQTHYVGISRAILNVQSWGRLFLNLHVQVVTAIYGRASIPLLILDASSHALVFEI